MRNALRDLGTAATLVTASLLPVGCRDPEESDRHNRPVASAPEVDVPRVNADTKNAIQNAIATQAAPNAEVSSEEEVPMDVAQLIIQLRRQLEKDAPAPEYRSLASEQLLALYPFLREQMLAQTKAKDELLLADGAVAETRKQMLELGRLSTPRYSETDIALIKEFLLKNKLDLTTRAMIASNAIDNFKVCDVDPNYPELSVGTDQTWLKLTIVLYTTDGGPQTIKIPHKVTVSANITKLGVVPDSVRIHNDFPIKNREFRPQFMEDGLAEYFGTMAEHFEMLRAEEPKTE